jgi:hypothetical protein
VKKKLQKFSLKKKLVISGLALILILLLALGSLLAYIYFSPSRVRNFQIGDKSAQVNITPGGINILIPRDDTSYYYSHNFTSWEIITGANTKFVNIDFRNSPEPTYPGATPYLQSIPYPSTILTKYKYDESAPKGSLVVNLIVNIIPCSPYDRRHCLAGPSQIILSGWRIADDGTIALSTPAEFSKQIFVSSKQATINNITPGEYIIEFIYKDPTEKDTTPNIVIHPGKTTTLNIDLTEYFH